VPAARASSAAASAAGSSREERTTPSPRRPQWLPMAIVAKARLVTGCGQPNRRSVAGYLTELFLVWPLKIHPQIFDFFGLKQCFTAFLARRFDSILVVCKGEEILNSRVL
jgi:hypothetical protein